MDKALAEAGLDIREFLKKDKAQAREVARDFAAKVLAIENATPFGSSDSGGECWLWFMENTHPYVRSLIGAGRIKVNKDGKYLADLREFDGDRSRLEREAMAERLARALKNELELDCCYYSVLEGEDPDSEQSFFPERWDNDYYFNRTD